MFSAIENFGGSAATATLALSGSTDIDSLQDGGNCVLTFNSKNMLDISSNTNVLKVLGDAGDSVNIVGGFNDLGVVGAFHRYELGGGAVLLVDQDITSVT